MVTKEISIGNYFKVGANNVLALFGGTCVIENEKITLDTAEQIIKITSKLGMNYVYKSSFDKANRSSISTYRGPGMKDGLKILKKVKDTFGIPIITDVHEPWQCEPVAEVADIIQIPAFLSRQTDLLMAAGKTGRVINIKKAQFMAAHEMKNVIKKIEEGTSNTNILLTERGTMFGYNNLIVDMTSLVDLRKYGYPVVFDATHSTQKPGALGNITGGAPEYTPYLLNAATAIGIDAIFAEIHPNPTDALSDSQTMIKIADLQSILERAVEINNITHKYI